MGNLFLEKNTIEKDVFYIFIFTKKHLYEIFLMYFLNYHFLARLLNVNKWLAGPNNILFTKLCICMQYWYIYL